MNYKQEADRIDKEDQELHHELVPLAMNATTNACINMGKLTCPSMAVKLPNKQPNFDAITKIRENLALRAEFIHN